MRAPSMLNLRTDPFERGNEDASVFYDKYMMDRAFLLVPAQAIVAEFLKSFAEFPPRAKPASFSIDLALDKAREAGDKLAAAGGGASAVQATTPKPNGAGLKKKEKEVAAHN